MKKMAKKAAKKSMLTAKQKTLPKALQMKIIKAKMKGKKDAGKSYEAYKEGCQEGRKESNA